MTGHDFTFAGETLTALPSRALWWPGAHTLVVADLHLGKAGRIARRSGALLPPYEVADTLARLSALVAELAPARVICLGDSFDDDTAAAELDAPALAALQGLEAGRDWIWVQGNHDPMAMNAAGQGVAAFAFGPLCFRHIAQADGLPEVSGHYHPKLRLPARMGGGRRACFLLGRSGIILPAFGTYTGGLDAHDPAVQRAIGPGAVAVVTGQTAFALPLSACG
ncbi:ligase-associated DNA damage response endonuclease PdeM [Roseicitreum antarcticum]|uniref:Putative phosphoesterase n=1 Tax=Roseicitreum antarcticum TaxID=564137 RepID=A0A1H2XK26_9RHOB|nr:ligase-associated DNA damage response endonuclease PdeM [Roseicitreum antarcticum]SDW93157.1 putative phosphoesterase [Roseicitreum antarcticum]